MAFTYIFGFVAIAALLIQTAFGYFQVKHFNTVYQELRRKGKVAIGRRSGKIQSGTIVFFAVDKDDKILDARIMQGVTVLARFKPRNEYIGQDIHFIDRYHPLVQKENKLIQIAMEDAREIYLRVAIGNYVEEKKGNVLQETVMNVGLAKNWLLSKFNKRSV
ncbi:transcriptional regulator [Aerococcus agrisoli]|uniref:Transcriptional regulator n=1 Tax=Aerococcus agrisoli TaxID=2487350 RepID=A0A3N4GFX3_9LACT|nr:transcriptional regulator GutM [Aerococcus agrisoli]RPA60758.1 transcriptional regulator [Aerococcus agrisoli]